MAKKPRNYAATEATLINVRAQKKRTASLNKTVKALDIVVEELLLRFEAVLERLTRLEARVDHIADTALMTDAMPSKRSH